MRAHLSRGTSDSVRMLWVRSASLIRITRTSRAMASSILRNDSAWFSSRVLNCSLSSLVRPSTSSATGEPKRSISSGLVTPQSSMRVVQQGGHQGLGVELPFGALGGHGDRVGDVGLAAVADLAQMGFVGKPVGQADLLQIGGLQVVQLGGRARQSWPPRRSPRPGWACRAFVATGWSRRFCRRGFEHGTHPLNIARSTVICRRGNKKAPRSGAFW